MDVSLSSALLRIWVSAPACLATSELTWWSIRSGSAGSGDVIGVDLGTTNSCVAIMEGKMEAR
eukprot:254059-Rhodomonas_salina.3